MPAPASPPLARCVPSVYDAAAAARAWADLESALGDVACVEERRAVLSAAFGASPYLARTLRRRAGAAGFLERPFADIVAEACRRIGEAGRQADDEATLWRALRDAKADAHAAIALADVAGDWPLETVTAGLSDLADDALRAAIAASARFEARRGRLGEATRADGAPEGFVVLAMGKHGAHELNYSSDIDLIVLYDRDRFPVAGGRDPHAAAVRLTQQVARALQEVTGEGYVFRVDLRLRPDPGATAAAISTAAALRYYESLGQTWERAALIKARPCAGDIEAGEAFLADIAPFIWRRSIDYAAVDDLHAMKRQIQKTLETDDVAVAGADLKRGVGGIREIEFFVQGNQLLHGGRDPSLRGRGTLAVLERLVETGHVQPAHAAELAEDYAVYRVVEHRAQMIDDQQTHVAPADDAARARLAAFSGYPDLAAFDADLRARFLRARGHVDGLFPDRASRPKRWRIGAVDDPEETLERLRAAGFQSPEHLADTVRAWRAGRVAATRSNRARGLLDDALDHIIDALCATGAPDAAFVRFREFFEALPAGVQLLSLFVSEPALLRAVIDLLAYSPRLARTLAQKPAAIDAMLEPDFHRPVDETAPDDAEAARAAVEAAASFEAALNAARRLKRDADFRADAQTLLNIAAPRAVADARAALADGLVQGLTCAARREAGRRGGAVAGDFAVLGLGKLGGRELSAASDLDLMTVYRPADEEAGAADAHFTRVTKRLIAALSAPTDEGGLYEVDMQLRPSGKAGPIAVRFSAFTRYYEADAWTWELMALTRARVVAAEPDFAAALAEAIRGILVRPRDAARTTADIADMRDRLRREKPARWRWDLKRAPGGLVDIEFALQCLQLVHAADAPAVLAASSREALARLRAAGRIADAHAAALEAALALQLDLTQVISVALDAATAPPVAPERLRARLAAVAGEQDFAALERRLEQRQEAAAAASAAILAGAG